MQHCIPWVRQSNSANWGLSTKLISPDSPQSSFGNASCCKFDDCGTKHRVGENNFENGAFHLSNNDKFDTTLSSSGASTRHSSPSTRACQVSGRPESMVDAERPSAYETSSALSNRDRADTTTQNSFAGFAVNQTQPLHQSKVSTIQQHVSDPAPAKLKQIYAGLRGDVKERRMPNKRRSGNRAGSRRAPRAVRTGKQRSPSMANSTALPGGPDPPEQPARSTCADEMEGKCPGIGYFQETTKLITTCTGPSSASVEGSLFSINEAEPITSAAKASSKMANSNQRPDCREPNNFVSQRKRKAAPSVTAPPSRSHSQSGDGLSKGSHQVPQELSPEPEMSSGARKLNRDSEPGKVDLGLPCRSNSRVHPVAAQAFRPTQPQPETRRANRSFQASPWPYERDLLLETLSPLETSALEAVIESSRNKGQLQALQRDMSTGQSKASRNDRPKPLLFESTATEKSNALPSNHFAVVQNEALRKENARLRAVVHMFLVNS